MNNTYCEYCGEALPLGVDKRTRRIRTAHFASCAMRPKRVEVEPPRREWRGLSEEEREAAIKWAIDLENTQFSRTVARAVEAKLKELNHD